VTESAIEFSRELALSDIPPEGAVMDLEASAAERARLARRFAVDRVIGFRAHIEARPWGGSGVVVAGSIDAEVEQTCVASLEPVLNRIMEDFEVRYVHPGRTPRIDADEVVVEAEGEDAPEELHGTRIDVGDLAAEHAVLAIDPYPRREDAEAVDDARAQARGEGGETDDNPFGALAGLKEKLKKR